MILKSTQITWKLKDGIVLKYGPDLDVPEKKDNNSEQLSIATEKELEYCEDVYKVLSNLDLKTFFEKQIDRCR